MNIVQLTPGAGAMICGNCLRDNALVAALRRLGHQTTMVPLYLPLTLDETDQSAGVPIFFGGINVYLGQKSPLFRAAPGWLRNLLASRRVLAWAAGRAAKTRAADLGELTLSMLQGEAGNQSQDLQELVAWLKTRPRPDLIFLSNALLLGQARRLRAELKAPVVCMLQGEDSFLDGLPEPHRAACWRTLAERAAEVELLLAPSHYFANLMQKRLGLPADRVKVVYNGINLTGFAPAANLQPPASSAQHTPAPPTIGFFARMCREKGLDTLVDAFIHLRQRGQVPGVRLRIGGSCGPADEPFVEHLRARLKGAGLLAEVEFCPNLDRAQKLAFLGSLSVFSVPARYGEAFGLYVLEALAAGVPVVQPRTAAFPELLEATGGGVSFPPEDPKALAAAIEELLSSPQHALELGHAGQRAIFANFTADAMARTMLAAVAPILKC